MLCYVMLFAILETRGELEPKCVPQLFLGSLLRTRWSAIGQIFSTSLVTVPEVFAKVNSSQFPSRFLSGAIKVIWASPRFGHPHSQTLVIWAPPVTLTQIAKVI